MSETDGREVGQELRDLIATAGNYGAWNGRDVLSKALMELDRLRAENEALRAAQKRALDRLYDVRDVWQVMDARATLESALAAHHSK